MRRVERKRREGPTSTRLMDAIAVVVGALFGRPEGPNCPGEDLSLQFLRINTTLMAHNHNKSFLFEWELHLCVNLVMLKTYQLKKFNWYYLVNSVSLCCVIHDYKNSAPSLFFIIWEVNNLIFWLKMCSPYRDSY